MRLLTLIALMTLTGCPSTLASRAVESKLEVEIAESEVRQAELATRKAKLELDRLRLEAAAKAWKASD